MRFRGRNRERQKYKTFVKVKLTFVSGKVHMTQNVKWVYTLSQVLKGDGYDLFTQGRR